MQYGIAGVEYKYKNISLKLHSFLEFSPLGEIPYADFISEQKKSSLPEKVKVSDFDILL